MEHALRVLIVGDSVDDAELVRRELCREYFCPEGVRVETEDGYLAALNPELDVVIADYELRQFNASRALVLAKQQGLDVPVIVVSGPPGEQTAVRIMREGAADYLVKGHLGELGMAVRRAQERRQLESSQRRLAETTCEGTRGEDARGECAFVDQCSAVATARRKEQQVRLLLDSATEGIVGLDMDGVCTFANQSAMRLLGCDSTLEMLGKHTSVGC